MYVFRCIGRLIVIFNVLALCQSDTSLKIEQVLSDVLKNITLANKVLQKLLKNYERLEKVYQSEKKLKSDTTETEVDESFKNLMPSIQSIKQRERSFKQNTRNPYIGTAIIYDSESVEKASQDTNVIKKVNENVKTSKKHPNYVKDRNVVTEKVLNNKFQNAKSEINTSSGEKKSKLSKESSSEDIESDEVEQIFIEIPSEVSDVALKSSHERIVKSYSNKSIKNMLGEKTRFSIQRTFPNKIRNNGRRIKKVVYSELFSPNEIKHSLPVRLRNYKNQRFLKRKSMIKNNEKITVLILTNNEEKRDSWKVKPKKTKSNVEEYLRNNNFLNESLRSEYGDACLQMPIKKCKKALQIVNKNICKRRFKCKSDFKSDFVRQSSVGCNKEFAYREMDGKIVNDTNLNEENTEKFSPPEFGRLKKSKVP
ncbi:uncharacterized protein LOC120634700 [Pararge aegeria]|uniref:uncharacterized protein LOC120634700 n=1 Tax=Pararge aegeria TaxID=116150 RepID=UPI0019D138DD|nr:uncharacterized protein LOC120634700 [Pararge aegeria]